MLDTACERDAAVEGAMAAADAVMREIEALKAELTQLKAAAGASEAVQAVKAGASETVQAAKAAMAEAVSAVEDRDVKAVLAELRAKLEDGLEEAETFTGEHPVVAVSAAFLLGVIVGRLGRGA
jgi:ElaB/YqjD/DUF883 family membrane-anchored ribosome-binding protein